MSISALVGVINQSNGLAGSSLKNLRNANPTLQWSPREINEEAII
jgi:hypothetical protein